MSVCIRLSFRFGDLLGQFGEFGAVNLLRLNEIHQQAFH
jgi:hypothetical protein